MECTIVDNSTQEKIDFFSHPWARLYKFERGAKFDSTPPAVCLNQIISCFYGHGIFFSFVSVNLLRLIYSIDKKGPELTKNRSNSLENYPLNFKKSKHIFFNKFNHGSFSKILHCSRDMTGLGHKCPELMCVRLL